MKSSKPNLSLLILTGILIGVGLVEIGLRCFAPFPKYPNMIVPNEFIGFTLKPDSEGRSTNRMGEYDTRITTNSDGFRDSNHPLEKPPHTIRIAFLGDSFTLADQVEEKESFVRLTEQSLGNFLHQQPTPWKVECMNFGIGGFDTQQEVLTYESYVRKYQPDVVLLMMYPHNDLIGNIFYEYEREFGRPYFKLQDHSLVEVPSDPGILKSNREKSESREKLRWYHHLHLYNAQKNLLYAFRQRLRTRQETPRIPSDWSDASARETFWKTFGYRKYRYYAQLPGDPWIKDIDDITQLLLERLIQDVQADGCRLFVVLLPAEENLFPERWPTLVKAYPGLQSLPFDFDKPFQTIPAFIPELANDGDILDLRPALKAASEQSSIFFKHDFHYNRQGQAAVAQALVSWLQTKLLHEP